MYEKGRGTPPKNCQNPKFAPLRYSLNSCLHRREAVSRCFYCQNEVEVSSQRFHVLVCCQAKKVGRKVLKASGELERIGMPDDQLESSADEQVRMIDRFISHADESK